MFTGFTYKGIHTSTYQVISKTKNRPILSAQKSTTFQAHNMDGQYDFSQGNIYGRPFYEDRIFEMEMLITADSITNLQNKISSVAGWIRGSGELVFDDMPFVIWDANVITGVDFTPKIYGKEAILNVQFRVKPWSKGKYTSDDIEKITLGEDIPLGSDIMLDPSLYFNFNLVSGTNNIELKNIGSYYIRPIFEFTGSGSQLKMSYKNQTLSYSKSFTKLSIDTEKQLILSNGTISNQDSTGEFFEFTTGQNTVKITVTGSLALKIIYTPRYLYNNTMFGGA